MFDKRIGIALLTSALATSVFSQGNAFAEANNVADNTNAYLSNYTGNDIRPRDPSKPLIITNPKEGWASYEEMYNTCVNEALVTYDYGDYTKTWEDYNGLSLSELKSMAGAGITTEVEDRCANNLPSEKLPTADLEYTFQPVSSADTATRETARRFYEWNPPADKKGKGSLIAAHIRKDAEVFFEPRIKLGYFPITEWSDVRRAGDVIIANEESWADTLAGIANIADLGPQQADLILNKADKLEPENRVLLEKLFNDYETNKATIIGGTKVISPYIEQELRDLGFEVERKSGSNRISTMTATYNTDRQTEDNAINLTFSRGFPAKGGSASGAYVDTVNANFYNNGLLLVSTDEVNPEIKDFLDNAFANKKDVSQSHYSLTLYGGTKAISKDVENMLAFYGVKGKNGSRVNDPTVMRIDGATRYQTALDQLYTVDESSFLDVRSITHADVRDGIIIVDGQADDLFKVAYPARYNFDRLFKGKVVYAQGGTIPKPTREFLEMFGNPAKELLFNEHRFVFCYASEAACAQAREIMGAK